MPCGGLDFSPVSGFFLTNNSEPLMAEPEMKGGAEGGVSVSIVPSVNLKPRLQGENLDHLCKLNILPVFQITFPTQSQSFICETFNPREVCRELVMTKMSFLNFP